MKKDTILIGLVGEIGSGKGSLIEILKKIIPKKQITVIKFSDVLADVLNVLAMKKTRNNLQKMAIAIDDMFGKGTFNNAVKQRVLNTKADIIIADGMRWPADEKMIRDLNGFMFYITASQKLRYDRTTKRGEKVGENETTFEEFKKQELMKNETYIKEIGSRADYKIINEGSLEEFKKKIINIIGKINL